MKRQRIRRVELDTIAVRLFILLISAVTLAMVFDRCTRPADPAPIRSSPEDPTLALEAA